MFFSVNQISLVLLNLVALSCLAENEIKNIYIIMVPKQDDANCINCHLPTGKPKLKLPKYSEEYFTKELSVREIPNSKLRRLIKLLEFSNHEKQPSKHEQLVQKLIRLIKYLREESRSHKMKEYLKLLLMMNEQEKRSPRSHDLRIVRGKPGIERTKGNLRTFRDLKYARNVLSDLKSHKLKRFLKYLRNGTLEAKSPMMKAFLRTQPHNNKTGQGFNKTDEEEVDIDIEKDFIAHEEGFFDQIKEKFIDFMEYITGGGNYLTKRVRRQ